MAHQRQESCYCRLSLGCTKHHFLQSNLCQKSCLGVLAQEWRPVIPPVLPARPQDSQTHGPGRSRSLLHCPVPAGLPQHRNCNFHLPSKHRWVRASICSMMGFINLELNHCLLISTKWLFSFPKPLDLNSVKSECWRSSVNRAVQGTTTETQALKARYLEKGTPRYSSALKVHICCLFRQSTITQIKINASFITYMTHSSSSQCGLHPSRDPHFKLLPSLFFKYGTSKPEPSWGSCRATGAVPVQLSDGILKPC